MVRSNLTRDLVEAGMGSKLLYSSLPICSMLQIRERLFSKTARIAMPNSLRGLRAGHVLLGFRSTTENFVVCRLASVDVFLALWRLGGGPLGAKTFEGGHDVPGGRDCLSFFPLHRPICRMGSRASVVLVHVALRAVIFLPRVVNRAHIDVSGPFAPSLDPCRNE